VPSNICHIFAKHKVFHNVQSMLCHDFENRTQSANHDLSDIASKNLTQRATQYLPQFRKTNK
jgi:hypothetical protein